jgi:hypothetical protein
MDVLWDALQDRSPHLEAIMISGFASDHSARSLARAFIDHRPKLRALHLDAPLNGQRDDQSLGPILDNRILYSFLRTHPLLKSLGLPFVAPFGVTGLPECVTLDLKYLRGMHAFYFYFRSNHLFSNYSNHR